MAFARVNYPDWTFLVTSSHRYLKRSMLASTRLCNNHIIIISNVFFQHRAHRHAHEFDLMTNPNVLFTEMLASSWPFRRAQGESIRIYVAIEQAKLARGEVSHVLGFQDEVLDGTGLGRSQAFMICVATPWQLEFAAARGHTAILVDATHSTNQLKVCVSSECWHTLNIYMYFNSILMCNIEPDSSS